MTRTITFNDEQLRVIRDALREYSYTIDGWLGPKADQDREHGLVASVAMRLDAALPVTPRYTLTTGVEGVDAVTSPPCYLADVISGPKLAPEDYSAVCCLAFGESHYVPALKARVARVA